MPKCLECGFEAPRLQWTHFRYKCTGKFKNGREYMEVYPNAKVVDDDLAKRTAVTESNLIQKYGSDEGQKRWAEYKDKQALSNTLAYKAEKHGWSKDEFDAHNKSRASTLRNMIDRHGEEEGVARWDAYCERQRYTTSIQYFVEKHGEDEGLARYNSFCEKRSFSGFNLYSNIEKEFILWFVSATKLSLFDDNIFALDRQYRLSTKFYDFTDTKQMKIIEFNGDLWHANPEFYDDEFVDPYGRTAIEIWENDAYKQEIAKNAGFNIYYVWEYDYRNYPDETKQQILKWWSE